MSKIIDDGPEWQGCFMAAPYAYENSERQRVNVVSRLQAFKVA